MRKVVQRTVGVERCAAPADAYHYHDLPRPTYLLIIEFYAVLGIKIRALVYRALVERLSTPTTRLSVNWKLRQAQNFDKVYRAHQSVSDWCWVCCRGNREWIVTSVVRSLDRATAHCSAGARLINIISRSPSWHRPAYSASVWHRIHHCAGQVISRQIFHSGSLLSAC